MKISVFGTGYVGLVSAACFANSGNNVLCVDINESIIRNLKKSKVSFYEKGLEDLIQSSIKNNKISFTTSIKKGISNSDIFFICVGTPESKDGSSNIDALLALCENIKSSAKTSKTIFVKSTVPVGTCRYLEDSLNDNLFKLQHLVASNPEFLKEGDAINDFLFPDRIIIGTQSERIKKIASKLYKPFITKKSQLLFMDTESSEVTKYASNAFLATKISFINELSQFAEANNANIHEIATGMGMDKRVGKHFLNPGLGYGGSCFPKDINSLIHQGKKLSIDLELLKATRHVNNSVLDRFINKILNYYDDSLKDKAITIFGQSFKPNTSDIRESRGVLVAQKLSRYFKKIIIYDPMSSQNAFQYLQEKGVKNIVIASNVYESVKNSSGIIICTEWDEFKKLNIKKLSSLLGTKVIFDGRHILKPIRGKITQNNIEYIPI